MKEDLSKRLDDHFRQFDGMLLLNQERDLLKRQTETASLENYQKMKAEILRPSLELLCNQLKPRIPVTLENYQDNGLILKSGDMANQMCDEPDGIECSDEEMIQPIDNPELALAFWWSESKVHIRTYKKKFGINQTLNIPDDVTVEEMTPEFLNDLLSNFAKHHFPIE